MFGNVGFAAKEYNVGDRFNAPNAKQVVITKIAGNHYDILITNKMSGKSFTATGLDKKELKTLITTGMLPEECGARFYMKAPAGRQGEIALREAVYILKEEGHLKRTYAKAGRAGEEGKKRQETEREYEVVEERKGMLLPGEEVPAKITTGGKTEVKITIEKTITERLNESDFKPEDYIPPDIKPIGKKRKYTNEEEFEKYFLPYKTQTENIWEAATDFYARNDASKMLDFFTAGVNWFREQPGKGREGGKGTVNPGEAILDLDIYWMFAMVRSGDPFGFIGKVANIRQKGKKEPVEKMLQSADDIISASKTDEGRQWLVGILQNWERDVLQVLFQYGGAQAQEKVLDDISKLFKYGEGAYSEYQKKFEELKKEFKKTGNSDILKEIINPVDYEGVGKTTGGRGWLADGPSTWASRFFLTYVEKFMREKLTPVILSVKLDEGKTETRGNYVKFHADPKVRFKGEPESKEVDFNEEFLQSVGNPESLKVVRYAWLVSIQVGGKRYLANPAYDQKRGKDEDNPMYLGEIGSDGTTIYALTWDKTKETYVRMKKDGKDIVALKIYPVAQKFETQTEEGINMALKIITDKPESTVPRVGVSGGFQYEVQVYLIDKERYIPTPPHRAGGAGGP